MEKNISECLNETVEYLRTQITNIFSLILTLDILKDK